MQVNAQDSRNSHATSQEILHIIAASSDAQTCASSILARALEITGAGGAYFIMLDDAHTYIKAGAVELSAHQQQHLRNLGYDLPLGVHISPPSLYESAFPMKGAIVAPLSADDAVIQAVFALFFDQPVYSLQDMEKNLLSGIIDGLTIVAARMQAHIQQQLAHQLTRSLLTSITDPLIVLNEDQRILMLNPAAERLFHTDTSHAHGHPLNEIVRSDELVALARGKNRNHIEWVSDDDMTFVPRSEPIYNLNGEIEGWVLALRDITHFKKLNRNQNEFTRIVSHDLRSPLTSMQGFASMLELGLVGELNERQKHFVEKILSGISQMTALVDNIQDAGRYDPETGFYEISRTPCDLGEIVRKIIETQLLPAEKQELTLQTHIADDIPIINADTNMLDRAITNLIDNAIKYTPNGGSIQLSVLRNNDQIEISVKDTGLGISPENQKHLFERHRRIPREEHKKIKGSGLGLFIVKSVAQRHGGSAWVESQEGHGSTFFMSIPLAGPNLIGSDQ
jgi:PAS domain S-box-containing protein